MLDYSAEEIARIAAQILEYMGEPQNAFGIWIMASGFIAGAHLLSPALLNALY